MTHNSNDEKTSVGMTLTSTVATTVSLDVTVVVQVQAHYYSAFSIAFVELEPELVVAVVPETNMHEYAVRYAEHGSQCDSNDEHGAK